MGKSHSKDTFNQWDLDRFSNVTGIPRATVDKLYVDFVASTGKSNRMDKKEFRRLYKELYFSNKSTSGDPVGPNVLTDHDLEKLSDRVFQAFDGDGTGKLTFEEFVNAYVLLSRHHPERPVSAHDRFTYILDHNNPTPGFVTRDQGEQVFNRLNRFYTSADSTGKAPVSQTWEQHWTKLDDGSGRIPQEKFVEYVTSSDDYKHHFDRALV